METPTVQKSSSETTYTKRSTPSTFFQRPMQKARFFESKAAVKPDLRADDVACSAAEAACLRSHSGCLKGVISRGTTCTVACSQNSPSPAIAKAWHAVHRSCKHR